MIHDIHTETFDFERKKNLTLQVYMTLNISLASQPLKLL